MKCWDIISSQPFLDASAEIVMGISNNSMSCRSAEDLWQLRRNTDVFQGDLAGLCREDSVLMRGKEFLEVPLC